MNDSKEQTISGILDSLVDQLAHIEHERWSHWQIYVHSNGLRQADGSLMIPSNLVGRWERQMSTSYADLSDEEKSSDRAQVQKYLPIILRALTNQ